MCVLSTPGDGAKVRGRIECCDHVLDCRRDPEQQACTQRCKPNQDCNVLAGHHVLLWRALHCLCDHCQVHRTRARADHFGGAGTLQCPHIRDVSIGDGDATHGVEGCCDWLLCTWNMHAPPSMAGWAWQSRVPHLSTGMPCFSAVFALCKVLNAVCT